MSSKIGYGEMHLIREIIKNTWGEEALKTMKFTSHDILYIMQEMRDEEGKSHLEHSTNIMRGFGVFRSFAKYLLYRNIANYDSMVLMTSEKGCLTDDSLLMIPRDLTKYPNGVPLKELIDKGPLKVYSFNNTTKKLELKDSDGVVFAKYDIVYKLTLSNGYNIKATNDHPFMLMDGTYKQLKDLTYDDNIQCILNGKNVIAHKSKIEKLGKQNVYDVVNVRDNKNFIANGFVVSNTGKSSAAIMLARAWCKLLGIRFNPDRHIAYTNQDMMDKIKNLNRFEPLVADEAVRFASSADWAKKESKELKKTLAQVRTKHLLFILCFPLKINKVEKNYLESFVNYWIDLFGRGKGAIYVKDKNPSNDTWRIKDFKQVGAYNEFTELSAVEKKLKKHPNFWKIIKFPKPPEWLYTKYLEVREKNVYNNETTRGLVTTEDVHRALLLLALQDIMMNDTTFTMSRISLHIKNMYDIPISKKHIQEILMDSKQLVTKIREEAIR